MTDAAPAMVLAARYQRAFALAVVIIVAGWHLFGDGPGLVADLREFGSAQVPIFGSAATVQLAAWWLMSALMVIGSVRLLQGRPIRIAGWALAGLALVIGTAAAATCPATDLLKDDWAWNAAGWTGTLALVRRPLVDLAVFETALTLATLGMLARDGGLNQASLAGFIAILAASAGIQFAVVIARHALDSTAAQAALAAQTEADLRAQRVIAVRVHEARCARWMDLQDTAAPLLRAMAAGQADPGQPEVRQGCAVEAARLRRLLAESDDVPSPLMHELQACADIAERRGVAVDIETAGVIPGVPAEIRRALTDVAIWVLTRALTRARITVSGDDDGLAVCLVADVAAAVVPLQASAEVTVAQQQDQQDFWLEAQWNP